MSRTARHTKADSKRAKSEQKSEKKDKELYLLFLTQMQNLASDYCQYKAQATTEGNSKAMRAEVEMETLAKIAKDNIQLAQSKIGDPAEYVKNCLKQADKEKLKSRPRVPLKVATPPAKKNPGLMFFTKCSGWIGIGGSMLFLTNLVIDKVLSVHLYGTSSGGKGGFGDIANQVYIFAAVLGLGAWCVGKLWIKTVEKG
ncbi:MAG: hypothetical protein FWG12_05495 [Holophagaceae bacterium]|nr:hypothetical protein [Holophagaceae bacterium]